MFEIFTYNKTLETLIDGEQELPYSSPFEVEIRAATVVAIEMIREQINKRESLKGKIEYSYEIDWLLWQIGEAKID